MWGSKLWAWLKADLKAWWERYIILTALFLASRYGISSLMLHTASGVTTFAAHYVAMIVAVRFLAFLYSRIMLWVLLKLDPREKRK